MLKVDSELELNDFYDVLFKKDKISLGKIIVDRVENSHNFLKEFSENKIIYGVNTGFGPMAQYKIDDKDQVQLQYNLIRSHASGTGEPLSPTCVKVCYDGQIKYIVFG